MGHVQLLQLLVPLAGQEQRSVLAALLVDLAAGVEVERRGVGAATAAHQQHLALLHEEEHAQAGAAAAGVQRALPGAAVKDIARRFVACAKESNKIKKR